LTKAIKDNILAIIRKDDYMPNRLYTQREVAAIFTDVPNKTLIYWARQGLMEWAAETRDARGIARLYNFWNLFQIGLVRELSGLGFSIGNIGVIMEQFFKDYPREKKLVINDEGESVEAGLASEFYYSGYMPKYFIIMKVVDSRSSSNQIVLSGYANLTEDDPFRFAWYSKDRLDEYNEEEDKTDDVFNTTSSYIIIGLFVIKRYIKKRISEAILT
jgi:DNA-binding transcriptional MerR regulator